MSQRIRKLPIEHTQCVLHICNEVYPLTSASLELIRYAEGAYTYTHSKSTIQISINSRIHFVVPHFY